MRIAGSCSQSGCTAATQSIRARAQRSPSVHGAHRSGRREQLESDRRGMSVGVQREGAASPVRCEASTQAQRPKRCGPRLICHWRPCAHLTAMLRSTDPDVSEIADRSDALVMERWGGTRTKMRRPRGETVGRGGVHSTAPLLLFLPAVVTSSCSSACPAVLRACLPAAESTVSRAQRSLCASTVRGLGRIPSSTSLVCAVQTRAALTADHEAILQQRPRSPGTPRGLACWWLAQRGSRADTDHHPIIARRGVCRVESAAQGRGASGSAAFGESSRERSREACASDAAVML